MQNWDGEKQDEVLQFRSQSEDQDSSSESEKIQIMYWSSHDELSSQETSEEVGSDYEADKKKKRSGRNPGVKK